MCLNENKHAMRVCFVLVDDFFKDTIVTFSSCDDLSFCDFVLCRSVDALQPRQCFHQDSYQDLFLRISSCVDIQDLMVGSKILH
jgi:hypothetical protein